MLKTSVAVGLMIVAAAAAWMMAPASHAPSNYTIHTEGATCGTHHCAPSAICCPSCTTGELRCYGGTRCPECAPQ